MPFLLRNIQRLNYRQPTPIQRKTIPALLEGRDVVGMARTGSGKTAAFGIPMIQRLKEHCGLVGVRGLVVAPTRELAIQTAKALGTLAKGSDLRVGQVVGGETLEQQFAVLATNPDILVATPGRLLHLAAETRLSLKRVEMVVFDEADRLFEMGFAEQLQTLLSLMPIDSRQTVLFSATLPRTLAEFAGAGLKPDALFVRLDTETKISPDLTLSTLLVKSEARTAALLAILRWIYDQAQGSRGKDGQAPGKACSEGEDQAHTARNSVGEKLTIVFCATKHHVDYLVELLRQTGFDCGGVYGSMDQEARQLAVDNFRSHRCPILIVTDLAARGLDIPLLDNVINYDHPDSAKLFVHRVGRAARAGRIGTAYSLCSSDELPYAVDISRFLGSELKVRSMPQEAIDWQADAIIKRHEYAPSLDALARVMRNAYKQYYASRTAASPDGHNRAKAMLSEGPLETERMFSGWACDSNMTAQTESLKMAIHAYKPKGSGPIHPLRAAKKSSVSVNGKAATMAPVKPSVKPVDADFFLSYEPKHDIKEDDRAYAVRRDLLSAASDFPLNDDTLMNKKKRSLGDTARVAQNGKKAVKLESGVTLPASWIGDKYEQWKRQTHVAIPRLGEPELPKATQDAVNQRKKRWFTKKRK